MPSLGIYVFSCQPLNSFLFGGESSIVFSLVEAFSMTFHGVGHTVRKDSSSGGARDLQAETAPCGFRAGAGGAATLALFLHAARRGLWAEPPTRHIRVCTSL